MKILILFFFFLRSNVSLQYTRRSDTGWKRARTVVGGREDNFWTETPPPKKKQTKNPPVFVTWLIFFIASYRSSQSRQFEPVCEPFWVWTQPQNDRLINDVLVPCAAHAHLVWVHHIVLCSVSQQRAAKTSSLPLEATPSRRSPHWPDANRPPKGERAGLRSSLLRTKRTLFIPSVMFSLLLLLVLFLSPHPPPTLCRFIISVLIYLSPSVLHVVHGSLIVE